MDFQPFQYHVTQGCILSPLGCSWTFVKISWVYLWLYFCVICPIPWIYVSIPPSIPGSALITHYYLWHHLDRGLRCLTTTWWDWKLRPPTPFWPLLVWWRNGVTVFSLTFGWIRVLIVYMFSVWLGYPFPESLAEERARFSWWIFSIFIGISRFPVSWALCLEYMRQKQTQKIHHHFIS